MRATPQQAIPQVAWALLAGLAQAASLAWPGNGQALWWLQWLSLGVLAWLVRPPVPWRRAAWLGGLFATAWLVGTFWWLFISMHTYGGLAAPLAVLGVLGLAGFLASYYAGVLALFAWLAPAHRGLAALAFGSCWLLAELARGTWWTGFPWGAGGYAHIDGPLAMLARTIGVYGMVWVAAVLAMLAVQARRDDIRRPLAWGLGLVLLGGLVFLGWQRHCAIHLCTAPDAPTSLPISLALLQGNIPQDEKFQPGSGVPLALHWYADQLKHAEADLVIAPETAIPLLPDQLLPGYLEGLAQRYSTSTSTQAALLGIPLGDMEAGYTNSVIAWQPAQGGQTQASYQYDKHHLVPFGEFIPPMFKWFTAMMNIPLGDFNRGALAQLPLHWRGQRIAPNICYEDLFGEELAVRFTDPAQAPTFFVNFSNIGWFGDSLAIDQHLHISRMRALEFERPMVRATNTGATAVIDHRGVVTHQLPRHTRAVLLAQVQGRDGPATPYAFWVARWGLWPLWIAAVLVLLLAWRRPRAAARPSLAG